MPMDKHILILGSSGGMGSAACELFLKKGYTVWGLDRAENAALSGVNFIKTDLTDEASISSAFAEISAQTQSLQGIVHMAGMYALNSLVEMSEQEMLKIFNINLFSAMRVNRIFLPLLSKGSRIILTTSELAPLDPLPFTGIYAITKTALEQYAFSLRMELNLLGIKVSIIRPGAVKTNMLGASTAALDRFCQKTQIYTCNAKRFKNIVDKVESKNIAPKKIARKALKAMSASRPRYIYNINRNPLLRLLNILPQRLQVFIIKQILKEK